MAFQIRPVFVMVAGLHFYLFRYYVLLRSGTDYNRSDSQTDFVAITFCLIHSAYPIVAGNVKDKLRLNEVYLELSIEFSLI